MRSDTDKMDNPYIKYVCTCEDCGAEFVTSRRPLDYIHDMDSGEAWPHQQGLAHAPDCGEYTTVQAFWVKPPEVP